MARLWRGAARSLGTPRATLPNATLTEFCVPGVRRPYANHRHRPDKKWLLWYGRPLSRAASHCKDTPGLPRPTRRRARRRRAEARSRPTNALARRSRSPTLRRSPRSRRRSPTSTRRSRAVRSTRATRPTSSAARSSSRSTRSTRPRSAARRSSARAPCRTCAVRRRRRNPRPVSYTHLTLPTKA